MIFFLPPLASAQMPATAPLTVSTTTVRLGEPVIVTVLLPAVAGPIELDLERSTTDSFAITKVEKVAADRMIVEVIPLAVGRLPVSLYWSVTGPEGKTQLAEAPPLVLQVEEPPIQGPGEMKDIKPPFAARPPLWPWLLLLAAAAAAVWAYRRRKNRPAPPVPAPTVIPNDTPPEKWAEEQLDRLEASGAWEEGRHKDFYGRLTAVVRAYLEKRLGLPATRQTTAELLRALRRRALAREIFSPLQSLSERADLVKFSRQAPEPGWGALDLDGARRVVRELAPKDLAAAGGEKKP